MARTRLQEANANIQQRSNTLEDEETSNDNEEGENMSEEIEVVETNVRLRRPAINVSRQYPDLQNEVDQMKRDASIRYPSLPKITPTLPKKTRTTPSRTPIIPKPKSDETDGKNEQTCSLCFFMILCLLFFGALVGLYLKDPKHWSSSLNGYLELNLMPNRPRPDEIIASLDELFKTPQFNENVPAYGLAIMKNAFKNALDANAKAPVLLLLMATQHQSDLVHNISHQLANLIATGKANAHWPDSHEINSKHTEGDIESFYNDTFLQRMQPVLLLENLEQLDSSNAMVFHQFTDADNSVIPSTFTIVTLKYQQQVTVDFDVSLKELSEISNNELSSLWSNYWSKDNLDCVINRIAESTVVLVNKKMP